MYKINVFLFESEKNQLHQFNRVSSRTSSSIHIKMNQVTTKCSELSYKQKLEQIGISDSQNINKLIQIQTASQQLKQKLIAKLNQNKQIPKEALSFIQDICLQLSIHKDNFDTKKTTQMLQEHGIKIQNPKNLFARLDSLLYFEKKNFQQFLAKVQPILTEEFQNFQALSSQQQRKIIKALFSKNISYHILIPLFDRLGITNSAQFLHCFFEEEGINNHETPSGSKNNQETPLSESIEHLKIEEESAASETGRSKDENKEQAKDSEKELQTEEVVKNESKIFKLKRRRKSSAFLNGISLLNSKEKSKQSSFAVLDQYGPDAILDLLEMNGIQPDDERLKTFDANNNALIKNCINGNLIIPDWEAFRRDIQQIYDEVKLINKGKNADYIPELAEVNPDYFAISICTVDGQIMEIGDASVSFSAQSCSKPITYCIAVEQNNSKHQNLNANGQDYVHNFVGRQPSGRNFNDLSLNHQKIPHNPMINAGSIMCASLIDYDSHPADRYKKIKHYWERLTGVPKSSGKKGQIDIDNSVYQSEKLDADRNWSLGFLMQENKAFQEGKNPQFRREWRKTDLQDNLDLYFQCCSIKLNCTQMAKGGATLANNGICPFTNDSVFDPENVKNVLSLMNSCGMYDYSGEWSYLIGIPAKSGVSGIIYAVIPNVMCIAVYSPRVDYIGNSVKGVEFFKKFTDRFKFHMFDSFMVSSEKKTINKELAYQKDFNKFLLLEAASRNDIQLIRKLLAQKLDVNSCDYDKRTALHVAVSNNNLECSKFLLDHGADKTLKDRWNNTAYDDAVKQQSQELIGLLTEQKTN